MNDQLQDMPTDNNTSANSTVTADGESADMQPPVPANSQSNRKRMAVATVTVAGLIIVALAVWLIFFRASSPKIDASSFHYAYNKVQEYKLSSYPTGYGISIQKPTEFQSIGRLPYGTDFDRFAIVDFVQKKAGYPIGSLSIASSNDKDPLTASAGSVLAGPSSDPSYKNITDRISRFVSAGSNSRFTLSLGMAQPFSNPSIKSNAWQFDLSITDQKATAANDQTKPTTWKGKVVYAIGQKSYYYVALGSVDYNWQNSQSVWQQILDSLKIDQ